MPDAFISGLNWGAFAFGAVVAFITLVVGTVSVLAGMVRWHNDWTIRRDYRHPVLVAPNQESAAPSIEVPALHPDNPSSANVIQFSAAAKRVRECEDKGGADVA